MTYEECLAADLEASIDAETNRLARNAATLAEIEAIERQAAMATETYPDNGELECIPWQFCALEDAYEDATDDPYNDPYWMEPDDLTWAEAEAEFGPLADEPAPIRADALAQVAMQARTRRAVEIGRALAYRQAGNYVAMGYALDGARHAGMVERAFRAHA